jgi:hypothetical protein
MAVQSAAVTFTSCPKASVIDANAFFVLSDGFVDLGGSAPSASMLGVVPGVDGRIEGNIG